jgi:hypothetical protein
MEPCSPLDLAEQLTRITNRRTATYTMTDATNPKLEIRNSKQIQMTEKHQFSKHR